MFKNIKHTFLINKLQFLLFSMVGSYESTNCPSTNWIEREDFPKKISYIYFNYGRQIDELKYKPKKKQWYMYVK